MRLGEQVLEKARLVPAHPAVAFRDRTLSYSELASAIRMFASGLIQLGIQSGNRVALLLPNCPPFVISYYAATLIDAVAVPANPLLKPAELEYMWADAGVILVVTVPQLLPGVIAARGPGLRHIVCVESPSEQGNARAEIPGLISLDELMELGKIALEADPQQLKMPASNDDLCAVIIYTSGTTGRPKGAMLSHKNLSSNVTQARAALHLYESDVFLTVLPLFHSFAGTVCMNIPMITGAQTVLLENFNPARLLEAIERHRVTIFAGVPAVFQGVLQFAPERDFDFTSLRMAISGGAPLPAATLTAIESRFDVPVIEGDGPTECSPATSVNPLFGVRKVGSVGLPLPGVEIAIFDERENRAGVDEVGEIVVRGDNVMLGYLNQPEATAEVMAGGWYHTGDLGKIDSDGYVYIVDRKKDMIITSGLNVYPREIEDVLLQHPAVADCAVVGLADSLRGEQVAAVVILRPGVTAAERELAAFCRERLANYKVPRQVLFRDSLPRGGTGKVVKRLLKKELELDVNPLI